GWFGQRRVLPTGRGAVVAGGPRPRPGERGGRGGRSGFAPADVSKADRPTAAVEGTARGPVRSGGSDSGCPAVPTGRGRRALHGGGRVRGSGRELPGSAGSYRGGHVARPRGRTGGRDLPPRGARGAGHSA